MERVLVIIQATEAATESQALAFGLGAVEGGANIRLRHLETGLPTALEHQGYGHLKDEDIEWAQVIGLAIESPEPAEGLVLFTQQIKGYQKATPLPEKSVYIFGSTEETQSIGFAKDALQTAGFALIAPEIAVASNDVPYLQSVGKQLAHLT